jgi:hypothetical protein
MQVRATTDSPTIIVSLTTENGRISLGGVAGTIDLLIPATATTGLTPGLYIYDLELVSAGGEVTRIVEGNFKIKPEVTK